MQQREKPFFSAAVLRLQCARWFVLLCTFPCETPAFWIRWILFLLFRWPDFQSKRGSWGPRLQKQKKINSFVSNIIFTGDKCIHQGKSSAAPWVNPPVFLLLGAVKMCCVRNVAAEKARRDRRLPLSAAVVRFMEPPGIALPFPVTVDVLVTVITRALVFQGWNLMSI